MMMAFNKYKPLQTIAWITSDPYIIHSKVLYLQEQGFEVQISNSVESWIADRFKISPFLILIDIKNSQQVSDTILSDLKQNIKLNAFDLVGIIDNTEIDLKESFIESGGSACLSHPFGNLELLQLIRKFSNQHKTNFDLQTQIDEASQMALLAMENSSDLGSIISFIKGAMLSKHYPELADKIFKATEMDCESCLVEIKGHENNHYFSATKSSGSLISTSIDKDMQQYLLNQKQSGRIVLLENILQINQSNLVILLDGVPFQDRSKMERLSDNLVILSDVANRFVQNLATEENLHKTEKERQRFLNTLSHELRTPLNSILGFSKTLKSKTSDKPLGQSGLSAISQIIKSTEQINAIISTLIEISGNTKTNAERDQKIEIDNVLVLLQNEFKQTALNKGLDFKTHAPSGLYLFNDPSKLYNILKRVVDNAIKFTEIGKVSIEVTTDTSSDNLQQIIFKVKDSGIGISEKDHHKIFNEIGQLNTDHNRSHYGIGLGLYYAHLVAQQINGSLSVESSLGKGACFSLSLPITSENTFAENTQTTRSASDTNDLDDFLF